MPGFHIEHVMLKYLRKNIPRQKGGGGGGGGGGGHAGHSWPTPKSTLDPRVLNPPYPRTTFLHKKNTIITPLGVVVHLDKGQVGENPGNEVEGALVTNCSILKDFHI